MISRRRQPRDAAIATGVFAAMAVELIFGDRVRGPVGANLVVAALVCAPVAWRRIAPLGALLASAVAATVFAATLTRPQDLFGCFLLLSVLAFSAGAHLDRPRARVALGVIVLLIAAVDLATGDWALGDQVFPLALFCGWWAMGRAAWTRRRQTAELRARAAQLERERAERERGAVARERARIARELHDVVAHSVSVMVIQSGAARRVLDRDPDASIAALGAVEDTGREALAEMRRLLGILRPEGEAPEHEPQPSLAAVGALVDRARAAGLDVELRAEGEGGPLEPGVDLTAYRVVQEALTNALKHGGDGAARVTLRWSGDLLEVEVANRIGPGPAGILAGSGHGLMGMRERVALCGGELRAGPVGRGFVVRARLPRARALSPPAPAAA
ncbi:MAG: sensor histidine kinase [Solirubrobacteraceae bacterium]